LVRRVAEIMTHQPETVDSDASLADLADWTIHADSSRPRERRLERDGSDRLGRRTRCRGGVLTVEIPKTEVAKPRVIDIKS